MRTTLDIDRDLLEDAVRAIGAGSKTEAIEVSLREAIAARRRRELIDALGTFDLELSWEELHRLREDE